MMSPAGSSAARLIRLPVASFSFDLLRLRVFRLRVRWVVSEVA